MHFGASLAPSLPPFLWTPISHELVKMIGDSSEWQSLKDFLSSEKVDFINNKKTNIDLPKSNVLIFELSDGSEIAVRPSGTEPKIKFYFSVNTKIQSKEMYFKENKKLEIKLNKLIKKFSC